MFNPVQPMDAGNGCRKWMKGKEIMWYFSWMLGLPLAAAFAVLNAMWYEMTEDAQMRKDSLEKP
jgi:cyd operon protein YbgT